MHEIHITFGELRRISRRIVSLVARVTGYEHACISTAINQDIGVDGDDWDDVLLALLREENLSLDGMNFYDYFLDEGQIVWGVLPERIYKIRYPGRPYPPGQQVLTVADLITSKITGRFMKRTDAIIKLQPQPSPK